MVQKRLQRLGIPMIVVPVRLDLRARRTVPAPKIAAYPRPARCPKSAEAGSLRIAGDDTLIGIIGATRLPPEALLGPTSARCYGRVARREPGSRRRFSEDT